MAADGAVETRRQVFGTGDRGPDRDYNVPDLLADAALALIVELGPCGHEGLSGNVIHEKLAVVGDTVSVSKVVAFNEGDRNARGVFMDEVHSSHF